jgi:hypothetical protein
MTSGQQWKTAVITKGSGATVVVYSPPYGENARTPDDVTILWNGEAVFDGTLPERKSGPDGMPVTLLEIHCNPGTHVLVVKEGEKTGKETVHLNAGESHSYRIFGTKDGVETLIHDLGNAPKFR